MLVIASALSVQDVRDRPLEHQQAADTAHKKFDDERSEFVGTLKLWNWLETPRGASTANGEHKLSHRKQEQLLRENFISPRRVREWRDIHSQLHTVVAEHKWRLNGAARDLRAAAPGDAGRPAGQHRPQGRRRRLVPRRARHQVLAPSGRQPEQEAGPLDRRGRTGRDHAPVRRAASRAIEPQWLPGIAGHLIKTQLLEPHWEKKAAEVIALERATLYGIVIYANRRVNFGNVDPVAAREIFIREALVNGEWETRLPFLAAQPQADRRRSRNSSTSRAARTCWSTTS